MLLSLPQAGMDIKDIRKKSQQCCWPKPFGEGVILQARRREPEARLMLCVPNKAPRRNTLCNLAVVAGCDVGASVTPQYEYCK